MNPVGDVNGKETNEHNQSTFTTQMSSEQVMAWQAQVLEMTSSQIARLQNLISVQAFLLQGYIDGARIKCQEDPSLLPIPKRSLEIISAIQAQASEVVAPRSMESMNVDINKVSSNQESCQCCQFYGVPCLQN